MATVRGGVRRPFRIFAGGAVAVLLSAALSGGAGARPAQPNLALAKLSKPKRAAVAGQRIALVATVVDTGRGDAPAGRLGVTLEPKPGSAIGGRGEPTRRLKGARLRPLAAGSSTKVHLTLRLPAAAATGPYLIVVCADPANRVRESSESDNCATARPLRMIAKRLTDVNPILFVHGWKESGNSWQRMIGWFEEDGWPPSYLATYTYSAAQTNQWDAEHEVKPHVEELLAATGAAKVDIVTHSMGGLNTRWYIKELGGVDYVESWVSLGGPNHGTPEADLCAEEPSCVDMRPGSLFLTVLNAGDETPGPVRYGTWWSPCDGVIEPSSTMLAGADNHETGCLTHAGLYDDRDVYEGVRDFVK